MEYKATCWVTCKESLELDSDKEDKGNFEKYKLLRTSNFSESNSFNSDLLYSIARSCCWLLSNKLDSDRTEDISVIVLKI